MNRLRLHAHIAMRRCMSIGRPRHLFAVRIAEKNSLCQRKQPVPNFRSNTLTTNYPPN
jgi:hypothetical protein